MYDIVIIGSGPAGLSAAVYGLRAGKEIVVIEENYEGTGQVAESGRVDNYLGMPAISGSEMGNRFREHAVSMGAKFITATVTEIAQAGDNWQIKTTDSDNQVVDAKTVIYAAGAVHRHLEVAGEEELAGAGVSYCATCDGSFYKNADVVVVGGGDTAIDDALYLSNIANSVTVVHRRNGFRCAEKTLNILKNKANVSFKLGYTISEIKGDGEVEAVVLESKESGETITLDTEGVFVAVGMIPRTDLLKGVVELDESGYVRAGEDCVTSAKGLFAAGDVRTKQLRQVATAVADGANAVTSALQLLQ